MNPLEKALGGKEESRETIEIPILCRFSKEDDVWNGVAEDLPVAVSGSSFEEAQRNLSDALLAHLESVQEVGDIDELINHLRRCAKDRRFSVEEMIYDQPLVRFNAAFHDHRITALV